MMPENELTIQVPEKELDSWFSIADEIAQPVVKYDADTLKMANEVIKQQRERAALLAAYIAPYI